MKLELEIIAEVEVIKKRKPVLIKGVVKKLFDLYEIEVEEFLDGTSGRVIPRYSGVTYREKYYKINMPYKKLSSMVMNDRVNPIVGFYGHSNACKKNNKIKKS